MPIASFRSFVGIAKANVATYATTALTVGMTVLPVNGTVVPASSTIYIIDGANSETRAVTLGGGTSSLTVAALTFAHNVGTPIYWQLTASIGPADYLPVTSFADAADTIGTVDDTGIRGSNVSSYGMAQTAGESDINLAGDVIPDTFGYLLGSIFGAVDFSGGTPNVHTFAGMNTAASNGQPTELMLFIYDGFNTRLYVGCKASEVVISYDPLQLLKWTAKFKGFLSGVVTTPTPSFNLAIGPQTAWQSTTTIAGTVVPNLAMASFTIKRATLTAIQTMDGNQSPYKIWAGPLQLSGTLNTVMEDDSVLLNYISNTQPIVIVSLVNGTGATQVALIVQMTKCAFMVGWKPIGNSNGYVEVNGPITGISNTTDGNTAGGGFSPARVTLKNAVATGHYQ